MNKPKILILTYTDLNRDPIVLKQIRWLHGDYNLHVVCSKSKDENGVIYHYITNSGFLKRNLPLIYLKLGFYRKYTWNKTRKKLASELSPLEFDLIIVHHLNLLPLALELKVRAGVIFYAHEYYINMYDHSFLWRFFIKKYFKWLADNYIHRCDYLITVNESIKNLYEEEYKIKSDFIQNRVAFENLKPKPINPDCIRIIHHGLAGTNRRLELLIELVKHLDSRFTLTLILQSNGIINDFYIWKLKLLAWGNKRIIFKQLVPIQDVARMGNDYDIGLFFMPPTTLNIKFNLSNKVFQYIQSRLMLVVSPLPEIERIVKEYNLGIVSESFDPVLLARTMNSLIPEEIFYYKNQSHLCAPALGVEPEKEKLLSIVSNIIKTK